MATKKAESPSRLKYLDGVIKVLAKENPKRKGTKSFKMFALYGKCGTIGKYLKAGGKQAILDFDMEKGFIKFKPFKG